MASTFNIGLMSEKNSSRVLRPPGGGHSDIFGIKQDEIATPSKRKNHQTSTIGSCFNMVEETKEPLTNNYANKYEENNLKGQENNQNVEEKHDIVEEINLNGDEIKESDHVDNEIIENTAPTQKEIVPEPAPASRRVRVPPGGFSSALW